MRYVTLVRSALLLTTTLGAGAALAETYTPLIYRAPNGYAWMQVEGAGDNGVMSGFSRLLATPNGDRAGYFTPQGYRNMHPAGYWMSRIDDSWSGYHCGAGMLDGSAHLEALFWVGGGPAVNLHPGGAYVNSMALAGFNQVQVGFAQMADGTQVAGAWSRTPTSFRVLQAPHYAYVVANSTDGIQHAGQGSATFNHYHALLWPSTFSQAIDLHPDNFMMSTVLSNWGNTQVGYGHNSDNKFKAALWQGSKASYVDLHPSGFDTSVARVVRGTVQAGSGEIALGGGTFRTQAMAWHGTAASKIDLHSQLPMDFQSWHSVATDIDNNGNIVGYVASPSWGMKRPVIWTRQETP